MPITEASQIDPRLGAQLSNGPGDPKTNNSDQVIWPKLGNGRYQIPVWALRYARLWLEETAGNNSVSWGIQTSEHPQQSFTTQYSGTLSANTSDLVWDGEIDAPYMAVTLDVTADVEIRLTLTVPFGTEGSDKTEGKTTSASWENVAVLYDPAEDHWTEAIPNTANRGSEPHEARLIKANRTGLNPSNAPTGGISSDPDWELVDDATGGGEIAAGDYWPKISQSGYEIFSYLTILQVRTGSGNAATTDNYISGDRDK